MKKELQDKIFKVAPLLYGDKDLSMQETCMCWGLDVDDGWFDLLYELSEKLELHIKKFVKQNPNTSCRACGCSKDKHCGSQTPNPSKCLRIHKTPTKIFYCRYHNKKGRLIHWYYRNVKQKVVNLINRISEIFFYEYWACYCEQYQSSYPRASQVKEKFGELRLYLSTGTDEMFDLIDEATKLSLKICERCGNPGEPNSNGWIITLCKECRNENS